MDVQTGGAALSMHVTGCSITIPAHPRTGGRGYHRSGSRASLPESSWGPARAATQQGCSSPYSPAEFGIWNGPSTTKSDQVWACSAATLTQCFHAQLPLGPPLSSPPPAGKWFLRSFSTTYLHASAVSDTPTGTRKGRRKRIGDHDGMRACMLRA